MRTGLSVVQADGRWRAEIAWPNGLKSYYGRFLSESEAAQWVAQHRWLTEREMEPKSPRLPRDLNQPAPEFLK